MVNSVKRVASRTRKNRSMRKQVGKGLGSSNSGKANAKSPKMSQTSKDFYKKLITHGKSVIITLDTQIDELKQEIKTLKIKSSSVDLDAYEQTLDMLCTGEPDYVDNREVPGSEEANKQRYLTMIPHLVKGTTDKSSDLKARLVELKHLKWAIGKTKLKDLTNTELTEDTRKWYKDVLQTIVDCYNV